MDVIIVCHTEFGFVSEKNIIFDKSATEGVSVGVLNLIKTVDKYGARATFAVCPETVPFFPRKIKHEIGLHIHPGWKDFFCNGFKFTVGDKYLKDNCNQSSNSTVLRDYKFEEQLEMIRVGKDFLFKELGVIPKVFVAGRWSLNSNTIKALVEQGFTHDLSSPSHSISDHYDWMNLPRICLPYNPDNDDYQKNGDLPILITPISQTLLGGTVSSEGVITYGLPWLLSCFEEYYKLGVPLFHICLHSPSMTDKYYIEILEEILNYISSHKNINFKFASEVKKYPNKKFGSWPMSYLTGINKQLLKTAYSRIISKF